MERRVKERLVGAAVLVAAAIVLIPEMLSGPKRAGDAATSSTEGPFKTYTIDLNRPPGSSSAPTTTVEESAPPSEMTPVAPMQPDPAPTTEQGDAPRENVPLAENPVERAQASPEPQAREPTRVASTPAPTVPSPARPPSTTPTRETSTSATPPAAVPTARGWAVQLGSFSNRATAERIANEFSGAGQTAFVMPVKSGTNTLYRVRVGPFQDRAAAGAALASIKKRVANAAVVAHP